MPRRYHLLLALAALLFASANSGPALTPMPFGPCSVALGADGSLYIADAHRDQIRKVDPGGVITTVAGGSWRDAGGDGGAAVEARLNWPCDMAVGADGSVYIADTESCRIRKVSPAGIITTVAGNGDRGYSGDGGPATNASLDGPRGVAVGADGSLYVADTNNCRIRKVDPKGIITTVAGDGWRDKGKLLERHSGDGGPATQASLNLPADVVLSPDGSLYIADTYNQRIRKVDRKGIITTVAGDGGRGYSGDGGPATAASLCEPTGVAVGADGSLYIADSLNRRIRKVDPKGVMTTVAGGGHSEAAGGPATEARLPSPYSVAAAADGSLYIADYLACQIRKVDPDGIITAVARGG